MKKLVTTLDGTIWYATINEKKQLITGKREDVTDDAINAVVSNMMLQKEFKENGVVQYTHTTNDVHDASICVIDPSFVIVKKDVFDMYQDAYKELNGIEDESENVIENT